MLCRRLIIFHHLINIIKSHGRLVYFYIIYRNLKEKGEADIMAKIIPSLRDARLNKKGNFKEKVKVDVSKDVIKSEYMILTVKWNDRSEDIILKVK